MVIPYTTWLVGFEVLTHGQVMHFFVGLLWIEDRLCFSQDFSSRWERTPHGRALGCLDRLRRRCQWGP